MPVKDYEHVFLLGVQAQPPGSLPDAWCLGTENIAQIISSIITHQTTIREADIGTEWQTQLGQDVLMVVPVVPHWVLVSSAVSKWV
jgi:hypothetical protein